MTTVLQSKRNRDETNRSDLPEGPPRASTTKDTVTRRTSGITEAEAAGGDGGTMTTIMTDVEGIATTRPDWSSTCSTRAVPEFLSAE